LPKRFRFRGTSYTSECWQSAAGDHQSLTAGGSRRQGRLGAGQSKTGRPAEWPWSYGRAAPRCSQCSWRSNGDIDTNRAFATSQLAVVVTLQVGVF